MAKDVLPTLAVSWCLCERRRLRRVLLCFFFLSLLFLGDEDDDDDLDAFLLFLGELGDVGDCCEEEDGMVNVNVYEYCMISMCRKCRMKGLQISVDCGLLFGS